MFYATPGSKEGHRQEIASAYERLSQAHEKAGQLAKAIVSMHGAIEVYRKDLQESSNPAFSEGYYAKLIAQRSKRLGELYRVSDDLKGEIAAYQNGADILWQALEADAEVNDRNHNVWEVLASFQEEVARRLTDFQRHDEAAEWYRRAIEAKELISQYFNRVTPDDAESFARRGLWYQSQGRRKQAIDNFSEAIRFFREEFETNRRMYGLNDPKTLSKLNYFFAKPHIVSFIGQPNLIAGEELAPEFLLCRPSGAPVAAAAQKLLDDESERTRVRDRFAAMRAQFLEGDSPSDRAADVVESML